MTTPSTSDDPVPTTTVGAGSRRRHPVLLTIVVVLLLTMLVRALLVQSFYVSSAAMEPTLHPGDRVLVNRLDTTPARGDLVVADVARAFGGPDRTAYQSPGLVGRSLAGAASLLGVDLGEESVVLRVGAVGGEQVTVHGRQVTVPPGRVFLVAEADGSGSVDSRTAPDGPHHGTVATDDIVGTVMTRFWPLDRIGTPSS